MNLWIKCFKIVNRIYTIFGEKHILISCKLIWISSWLDGFGQLNYRWAGNISTFLSECKIAWWVWHYCRVQQGLMKKLGQLKHLQVHLRPKQVSIYVTCIYVTCFNCHKLLMHNAFMQTSQPFKSKQVSALHHSVHAFPTPS